MSLLNITNTYRDKDNNSTTKDLKKYRKMSQHELKYSLNPLDQTYYKFDWLILDQQEQQIMNSRKLPKEYELYCSHYDLMLHYEKCIIHQQYPQSMPLEYYPDSIEHHEIDIIKRHALVTWIGQAISCYTTASYQTYFLAIAILDKFLLNFQPKLSNLHLHALGISCIGLASKMSDIYIIEAKHLVQMSCGKIPLHTINHLQQQIVITLNNNLILPTYFNCFDYLCRDIEHKYMQRCNLQLENPMGQLFKFKMHIIYHKSLRLLKFITQYYDTSIHKMSAISYACIYYTIRRLEQTKYVIPIDLIKQMEEVAMEYGIIQTEIILKLIYKLCLNGLSEQQIKNFDVTIFTY